MREEIVDYKVVQGDSAYELSREVVLMIARGWQPYGDPYYSIKYQNQAMVKYYTPRPVNIGD